MKIGFIGLGRMGGPMARNIVASGAPVTVWDANLEAVQSLAAAGAATAENAADIAARCDVVFTSLPGPVQIEEVVFGPNGLLQGARRGQVYFDLSTSSLPLVKRMHQAFAERGAAMLDAPVSGGPAGAASGRLCIWIGGDAKVYERMLPVLRTFSDSPKRVGDIGAGTVAKLVHNLSCYVMLGTMAETFSLGVKAGVEPVALWEALYAGVMGRGSILDQLASKFLPGQYEPANFALKLGHKDVNLAMELGKQLGVPMKLAALTLEEMNEALGKGMGELDSHAYMALQLQRAGVQIAASPEQVAQARARIAAAALPAATPTAR